MQTSWCVLSQSCRVWFPMMSLMADTDDSSSIVHSPFSAPSSICARGHQASRHDTRRSCMP